MNNNRHTLNPFLAAPVGQLRPLVQSYVDVLGATLPSPLPDPNTGPVQHFEVNIGDATIGLNEIFAPGQVNYVWLVTKDIEGLKSKIQDSCGAWTIQPNPNSPVLHATDPAGVHWVIQPEQ
ncbi:MAG: hypothetical protein ACKVZH_29595 [Blastocatellia bacterium]